MAVAYLPHCLGIMVGREGEPFVEFGEIFADLDHNVFCSYQFALEVKSGKLPFRRVVAPLNALEYPFALAAVAQFQAK